MLVHRARVMEARAGATDSRRAAATVMGAGAVLQAVRLLVHSRQRLMRRQVVDSDSDRSAMSSDEDSVDPNEDKEIEAEEDVLQGGTWTQQASYGCYSLHAS